MLIELYGRNFGCFRDDFSLSLLATDIDRESSRGTVETHIEGEDEPIRVLRAVAIYGPNASGKTTVLKAAAALHNLLQMTARIPSDYPLTPYEPFALDGSKSNPVRLGIKSVVKNRFYDYTVEFTRTAIVFEQLECITGSYRKTLLLRQGQSVSGEWTGQDQFQLLSKNFRQNALLLALADILAPSLSDGIAVAFSRMLNTLSPAHHFHYYYGFEDRTAGVANKASRDPRFRSWLINQLRSADLGVADIKIEKVTVLVGAESENDVEERITSRLQLLHSGPAGSVPIDFNRESQGTHRIIDLSLAIYDILNSDIPLAGFADELDASLHPDMFRALVWHLNTHKSVSGATGQIVFTAHETSVLDQEAKSAILRRDQIYFTEKQDNGVARLYSLAEFRERNNLNIRKRYLQGRYGALPALQDPSDYGDAAEGQ